ncbi:MAG TPA: alpha/beta hydrolase [Pseudonocardia sp.]
MTTEIEYHDVVGIRTAVRQRGGGAPVIFMHGNPDTGEEWTPFLDRADELGRVIAPDLPGFGLTARPPLADFATLKMWFSALVDELGLERYRLVVHDWGSIALAAAATRPHQLEKLVVIDAVPLTAEYRWHWLARCWRTPVLGELAAVGMNRATLKQLSRLSSPRRGPMADDFLDEATRHLDHGTRRAILQLYRSADPGVLGAAGRALDEVRCPALVVWATGDPYLGTEEAYRYAEALPDATVELVHGAGHWCFREDPAVVDRIVDFLG